jgi:hypothetical protein
MSSTADIRIPISRSGVFQQEIAKNTELRTFLNIEELSRAKILNSKEELLNAITEFFWNSINNPEFIKRNCQREFLCLLPREGKVHFKLIHDQPEISDNSIDVFTYNDRSDYEVEHGLIKLFEKNKFDYKNGSESVTIRFIAETISSCELNEFIEPLIKKQWNTMSKKQTSQKIDFISYLIPKKHQKVPEAKCNHLSIASAVAVATIAIAIIGYQLF